jgi:hypothetical protein
VVALHSDDTKAGALLLQAVVLASGILADKKFVIKSIKEPVTMPSAFPEAVLERDLVSACKAGNWDLFAKLLDPDWTPPESGSPVCSKSFLWTAAWLKSRVAMALPRPKCGVHYFIGGRVLAKDWRTIGKHLCVQRLQKGGAECRPIGAFGNAIVRQLFANCSPQPARQKKYPTFR